MHNRSSGSLALILVSALTIAASSGGAALSPSWVIDDVTVIDGTGKPASTHMRVIVADGVIQSVQPVTTNGTFPEGATRIDGRGRFLIPGLWDTHVHLTNVDEVALPVFPAYGVTSVRDMGGNAAKVMEWRTKVEQGEILGPRIKLCGPMLEGAKWDRDLEDHWVIEDAAQARATVNRLADEGVDCIKMRTFTSPETFFALVDTARQRHLPFGGHAPWGVDPIAASNAGQSSFEHAYYPWPWNTIAVDRKREIERTFRKNGTLVVPTLVTWEVFRLPASVIETVIHDTQARSDPRLRLISPELRRNWIYGFADIKSQNSGSAGWNSALDQLHEQVAEMHDNGVGMMTGTDTGATLVYPGAAVLQELKLLVARARFTPMDALLSATIIPAKYFGLEDRLGTIEQGKLADMVLLGDDPLLDIANIHKIDGVMLRGVWHDRGMLDRTLRDVERRVAAAYEKGTRESR